MSKSISTAVASPQEKSSTHSAKFESTLGFLEAVMRREQPSPLYFILIGIAGISFALLMWFDPPTLTCASILFAEFILAIFLANKLRPQDKTFKSSVFSSAREVGVLETFISGLLQYRQYNHTKFTFHMCTIFVILAYVANVASGVTMAYMAVAWVMLGPMLMKMAREKGLIDKFNTQLQKFEEAVLPPKS